MKDIYISNGHCACGDYTSKNLRASCSCRKSGSSPDSSLGVAHLLKYEVLTEEGWSELGYLVRDINGYGCDYVRLEEVDEWED